MLGFKVEKREARVGDLLVDTESMDAHGSNLWEVLEILGTIELHTMFTQEVVAVVPRMRVRLYSKTGKTSEKEMIQRRTIKPLAPSATVEAYLAARAARMTERPPWNHNERSIYTLLGGHPGAGGEPFMSRREARDAANALARERLARTR